MHVQNGYLLHLHFSPYDAAVEILHPPLWYSQLHSPGDIPSGISVEQSGGSGHLKSSANHQYFRKTLNKKELKF